MVCIYLQSTPQQMTNLHYCTSLLHLRTGVYQTCSEDWITVYVTQVNSKFGETIFKFCAPDLWNNSQYILNLGSLITLIDLHSEILMFYM